MSDYFVHERLRELCIEKEWFTCGNNDQYDKLMMMSTSKYPCKIYSLHDMALVIWICSENYSLDEIEKELVKFKSKISAEWEKILTC